MAEIDKILPTLYDIGFDNQEAQIYFAMLKLGPSTITTIANQARIDRMTTFRVIHRLLIKNVVGFIREKKRKQYFPKNPESLIQSIEEEKNRLEEKQKRVQQRISDIMTLYQHGGARPFITYCEGSVGFRTIYQKILDEMRKSETKEYRLYSPVHASLYKYFDLYYPSFISKKIQYSIKSKTLSCYSRKKDNKVFSNKLYKLDDEKINTRRFIPDSFIFNTYQYILDKTVIYFSLEDDYCLGTIITHKLFCDSQRKIFDFVWQNAVPEKNVKK